MEDFRGGIVDGRWRMKDVKGVLSKGIGSRVRSRGGCDVM